MRRTLFRAHVDGQEAAFAYACHENYRPEHVYNNPYQTNSMRVLVFCLPYQVKLHKLGVFSTAARAWNPWAPCASHNSDDATKRKSEQNMNTFLYSAICLDSASEPFNSSMR